MTLSAWPPGERARAAVAHSLVNGLGVLALTAMHLWGRLSPEWAAGGVLVICGVWWRATRQGPPDGPPGAAGAVALAAELASRLLPRA